MNFSTYFKNLFDKASSKGKLYVYLFCLFLAIFFWLLNALGNNFSTTVAFNVNYQNLPNNQVILNELPKQININIKGLGFDLLAYKLQLKQPVLAVDLASLKNYNQTKQNITTKSLSTETFQSYISSQLGEHIEIRSIYPDSILFVLDERIEKTLKIIPKTTITYDKQYQIFGNIIVKPAVVIVRGPKSRLDTMTEIYTENVTLRNLTETATEIVAYSSEYGIQQFSFNPSLVHLHIPVEKFTESTRNIKLIPINVPDSIILKTIPSEIEVKFMIPLSKIVALESAIFTADIDYQQINENYNHKLKVTLTSYPDFIQSITLSPSRVEYILKKKDE